MEQRSQRRLIARESSKALSAGQHRSGVSLRSDQRRGPAKQSEFTTVVDEAIDRAAKALSGVWSRDARILAPCESQNSGIRATLQGRTDSGGSESIAFRPARRTRSVVRPRLRAG